MIYTIKSDKLTVGVNSLGAQLTSIKSPDFEYLWQPGIWKDQAPLLFPLCGRLKDCKYTCQGKEYEMDLHGFLMFKEFTPVTVSDTRIVLECLSSEETRAVYPFDFKVVAEYTLDGEDIHFDYNITNNSGTTMPYMFGWHPAFNLPTDKGQDINDYEINFGELDSVIWEPLAPVGSILPRTRVRRELENHSYKLCETEIYEQDTMIFREHNCAVTLFAEGHPYKLSLEWSSNIPTLCVWKLPLHKEKFICIEPWATYPKDGVTDNDFDKRPMPRLEAGETERYSYTLKITK